MRRFLDRARPVASQPWRVATRQWTRPAWSTMEKEKPCTTGCWMDLIGPLIESHPAICAAESGRASENILSDMTFFSCPPFSSLTFPFPTCSCLPFFTPDHHSMLRDEAEPNVTVASFRYYAPNFRGCTPCRLSAPAMWAAMLPSHLFSAPNTPWTNLAAERQAASTRPTRCELTGCRAIPAGLCWLRGFRDGSTCSLWNPHCYDQPARCSLDSVGCSLSPSSLVPAHPLQLPGTSAPGTAVSVVVPCGAHSSAAQRLTAADGAT